VQVLDQPELMIACELFKKQPAGTKIGSQTHTSPLPVCL